MVVCGTLWIVVDIDWYGLCHQFVNGVKFDGEVCTDDDSISDGMVDTHHHH